MSSTSAPPSDYFSLYDDVGLVGNSECRRASQVFAGTVTVLRGGLASVERVMSIAVGEISSYVRQTLSQAIYSVVEDSCSPTLCSQKAVPAEWKVEFEVNITNCEANSAQLRKIIVSSNWPYPVYVSNHTYLLVRTTTVYYDARNLFPHIVSFSHAHFPALCNFHQHYYLFDYYGCKFYRVCDLNPSFIPHGRCRRAVRAT